MQPQRVPERAVFMGTPEFAAPSLEALLGAGCRPVAVFTQPDKPAGRHRVLGQPPVKKLALEAGLPVVQPVSLKDPFVQDDLRALAPDVIVVVAYGKILPPAVLEIPRLGCVNVHASLLPRHRGASPIAHAIWAGDAVTGVTTMRMEAGLDTGPVYLRREVAVGPDATTGSLTRDLARLGAGLLVETLIELEAGTLAPVPQDESLATSAPRLSPEDGRLDFTLSAESLERQVRAFLPWPGTWFEHRGERIKVFSAVVDARSAGARKPGEVLAGPALGVACGDGRALCLVELQREGKRALPAPEVLRGFPIPEGTRL